MWRWWNTRIFRSSGNLLSTMNVTEVHLGFKRCEGHKEGVGVEKPATSRRQEVDVDRARVVNP